MKNVSEKPVKQYLFKITLNSKQVIPATCGELVEPRRVNVSISKQGIALDTLRLMNGSDNPALLLPFWGMDTR